MLERVMNKHGEPYMTQFNKICWTLVFVLCLAACSAHQQPKSLRTGFLLSGPGTLVSRNDHGIGVLFGNAGKTYVMNLEISGDYIRFYDQFSRRGYGEKIRFEFLPGDKVAVSGFVFAVQSLVEHHATSVSKREPI
jgi:hypothetical protein